MNYYSCIFHSIFYLFNFFSENIAKTLLGKMKKKNTYRFVVFLIDIFEYKDLICICVIELNKLKMSDIQQKAIECKI